MLRLVATALVSIALLLVAGCGGSDEEIAPPPELAQPATPTSTLPTTPEPPPPPTTAPEPPPPSTVPMSWQAAGAFVWHEADVSPEALGEQLRAAGFGWVAVFVHDGLIEDPVEGDWVGRFRRASGLPVGGWGALRTQPIEEAALADALVERYGLDFYVANAEAEYDAGGPDGQSDERGARSRAFVDAFRRLRPELPAGLSSYCRPDRHDLDWAAWAASRFVFLPQAYVNDFGNEAVPGVCVLASRGYFPAGFVHPTIGMHPGASRSLGAWRYGRLLQRAGTVGFSVYLAETRMTGAEWDTLAAAIVERGIAKLPAVS